METWKRVAQVGDISPDTNTLRVVLDGEGVCLYDLQGEICATQDRCPRQRQPGRRRPTSRTAPSNARCTRACSTSAAAKPKCPPVTTDLRRYEVKVDGDVIYLKAEAA